MSVFPTSTPPVFHVNVNACCLCRVIATLSFEHFVNSMRIVGGYPQNDIIKETLIDVTINANELINNHNIKIQFTETIGFFDKRKFCFSFENRTLQIVQG